MEQLLKVLQKAYEAGEYCGGYPEMLENGDIVVWVTTEDGEKEVILKPQD